jgi:hypothetical protein
VLTAQISLAGSPYDTTEKVTRLYRQTIERLRRLPGVESVAIINNAPMERGLNAPGIMLGPAAADSEIHAFDWRYITPDYFTLLRTPILQGRGNHVCIDANPDVTCSGCCAGARMRAAGWWRR